MGLPLNIDWQQILLHLFNFLILAGGLYLLLYKPVKQFMDKREQTYQAMNDAADQKAQQAQQAQQQAAQRLEQLNVEGQAGQPLVTPDHMGGAHQVIVDRVGEMIGRYAVRL